MELSDLHYFFLIWGEKSFLLNFLIPVQILWLQCSLYSWRTQRVVSRMILWGWSVDVCKKLRHPINGGLRDGAGASYWMMS